ncbi:hypothetical protein CHS0354_006188 [Potamilus streckersoni]|uniref:Uncharacterized protein n=1 Tax=Potamilus streckersoni TaxID=2493646 RepID=A0AAE0TGJ4_9BIVA|nr:hypothetical protein CHS0354_006188 [Potamilus streckersoni]
MYSSSRRRGFRVTIQIIIIFGYAAYLSKAMIPLSIQEERQHDFPKSSETLASKYHARDHLRTGIGQDEASKQRQKTVLVKNTGWINVNFLCDKGRIIFMNKNGTLISPQRTPSPFAVLVNSTQTSPNAIVNGKYDCSDRSFTK